ncbi:hypothetical protein CY34DRAFT_102163 [Suillus luteus UH-Slu-Lm8-n1]|uniref:Uncharacterized protein n=1 Tax=Suillus luteus UH-Slu-Lm8-n1 TaxID=930992 RepID=A0A0D0AJL9_9AGAM|nr:hypothetical protein CY34DRAFT_102163 [Suillus luteus UH-Slu-Lm8-n1]
MWGPGPTRPTSNPSPSILMHQDTGVLQDSTAPVINTGTTAKKGGRKRKKPVEGTDDQSNTRKQSNKKRKLNSGAVAQPPNAAAVCGVGPVLNPASESVSGPAAEPADVLVPQHENANVGGSRQPRESRAVATDVWYFLWALNDKERPDKMPENQPRLMAKPDCKYVACRLCG